ncbi:Crp/Fnr family transcriptional regulator [Rhizorhabdus dicambivorans]|uniref:Crp/Fnr family transcriptional regulator n=1 Tax=Rhizorhabdus dicambivorans TaxID=1850238 RepID=A0A2A4FVA1_9SPHN|nr:Crp/Fnr family transcriptional regulator [Rhizorhabdus dicambivorans]ATE64530.1 Crp/Fnr family transcriptional regulator [Rhizorhabdus dicambivorans]PCE41624.1 Crp/Fnr family transcriptional regulator [Rhizorhabdus dicambivorans]
MSLVPAERTAIEKAVSEIRAIPPRTILIEAGRPLRHSALIIDGLVCRTISDRDGLRQFVGLHLPGDFVDLHSYALSNLEHDISSVTQARVAIVPHDRIDMLVTDTTLARKLWFATLLDAAMHRAWLFRLGRLDAMGRVAHFLCETNARLCAVGLSDGRSFALDLTQNDLAEICGVTSIHMNRILRQLREDGLVTMRSSLVEIMQPERLAARGQFDGSYLYLDDGHPGPV